VVFFFSFPPRPSGRETANVSALNAQGPWEAFFFFGPFFFFRRMTSLSSHVEGHSYLFFFRFPVLDTLISHCPSCRIQDLPSFFLLIFTPGVDEQAHLPAALLPSFVERRSVVAYTPTAQPFFGRYSVVDIRYAAVHHSSPFSSIPLFLLAP